MISPVNDFNIEKFGKTVQDYVIKSFNEHYPNNDFLRLKFITMINNHESYIFDMNGILIRYDIDNAENDDEYFWSTICKIELNTTNASTYGRIEKYDIPVLSNYSSKNIRYELYPFDQAREIPLCGLGIHDDELKQLKSENIDCEIKIIDRHLQLLPDKFNYANYKCEWKDGFVLWIIDRIYAVTKNNKIISMFTDKSATYQLGDGSTECFLYNNKDLIIEHCGDVSSVVVIIEEGA